MREEIYFHINFIYDSASNIFTNVICMYENIRYIFQEKW